MYEMEINNLGMKLKLDLLVNLIFLEAKAYQIKNATFWQIKLGNRK